MEKHRRYYCSNESCERSRKSDKGGFWHAYDASEEPPEVFVCWKCGDNAYWSAAGRKRRGRAVLEQIEHELDQVETRLFGRPLDAPLDSSRIYLLARGQVVDVTARFQQTG